MENNGRLGPLGRPGTGHHSDLNLVIPSPGPVRGDRSCEQTGQSYRGPSFRVFLPLVRFAGVVLVQMKANNHQGETAPGNQKMQTYLPAACLCVSGRRSDAPLTPLSPLLSAETLLLSPSGGVALKPKQRKEEGLERRRG